RRPWREGGHDPDDAELSLGAGTADHGRKRGGERAGRARGQGRGRVGSAVGSEPDVGRGAGRAEYVVSAELVSVWSNAELGHGPWPSFCGNRRYLMGNVCRASTRERGTQW